MIAFLGCTYSYATVYDYIYTAFHRQVCYKMSGSTSTYPDDYRPGPTFNKTYFCSVRGFLKCVESVSQVEVLKIFICY